MKKLIVYGPDAKLRTIMAVWAQQGMRFELEDIQPQPEAKSADSETVTSNNDLHLESLKHKEQIQKMIELVNEMEDEDSDEPEHGKAPKKKTSKKK